MDSKEIVPSWNHLVDQFLGGEQSQVGDGMRVQLCLVLLVFLESSKRLSLILGHEF